MNQGAIPDALASYAESFIGVTEITTNRSPDIDFFVRRAGGNPTRKAPWCAHFVTFCCDALRRMGLELHEVVTGRAVNHWLKAPENRRVARDDIWEHPSPRGLIYVRTRTSKAALNADKVRRGISRQGHVGIILSVEEEGVIIGVAGNSSSAGHAAGGGAVCEEVIRKGDRAWERIVGFVSVVDPPEDI